MKHRIESIRTKVLKGYVFDHQSELFAGADLIVSLKSLNTSESKTVVVTGHAAALSGLIFELQQACSDWLDYMNKYDFYPTLGKAANQYLEHSSDLKGLLLSVTDAALKLEDDYNRLLYFAYGSNMDEARMIDRCPDAKLIGVINVPGWRFALDRVGVATILPDEASSVEGLLWSVTPEDIASLDKYEGVKSGCYRKETLPIDDYQPGQTALVYLSNRNLQPRGERKGYMPLIIQAALDHGFSRNYIRMLTQFLSDAERM